MYPQQCCNKCDVFLIIMMVWMCLLSGFGRLCSDLSFGWVVYIVVNVV